MKSKKAKPGKPKPFAGAVLTGRIPGGWDVERAIVEGGPLCSPEQWEQLGRPAVAIRYTLGYRDDDPYGHTYCHTGLSPTRKFAVRIITPSNCRGIDVGIVTPAGAAWFPAKIMRADDDGAARDYVRRRNGSDQPIMYWDYSLTEENVARYMTVSGETIREPVMDPGSEPDDPAELLRLADDGCPNVEPETVKPEDE